MVRYIWILSVLLIATGCGRRPGNVLSENKMVDLMVDIKLAEAYSEYDNHGPDYKKTREALIHGVLLEHGITEEELDSTISWYGKNLDDYSKVTEKVDKELKKRRQVMLHEDDEEILQADMLWPYSSHGVLTPLGNSDGWIFSLPDPGLQKGDIIRWNVHTRAAVPFFGVLGVEYENGSSEASTFSYSGSSIEMKLMTDTGKVVKRIYGTLRLKEPTSGMVFLDSIRMRRSPFDSLEYTRFRSVKKYGIPSRRSSAKIKESNDSTSQRVASLQPDTTGVLRHHLLPDSPENTPAPTGVMKVSDLKKARSIRDVKEETAKKQSSAIRPRNVKKSTPQKRKK